MMQGNKISDPTINAVCMVALYMKLNAIQIFRSHNFDVTPEQFGILWLLYENGCLYQRQLSQRLFKDRANITRMINILEKRELVCRKEDAHNKRIHKIYLTEEGIKKVESIVPALKQIEKYVYNNISEEEKSTLIKILGKILVNLESKVTIQI